MFTWWCCRWPVEFIIKQCDIQYTVCWVTTFGRVSRVRTGLGGQVVCEIMSCLSLLNEALLNSFLLMELQYSYGMQQNSARLVLLCQSDEVSATLELKWCNVSLGVLYALCVFVSRMLLKWSMRALLWALHTEQEDKQHYSSVLFFSRPRSEGWTRHGRTSPFIPVLCYSDWLFHRESCPRLDVVHPGSAWSSSPVCTWQGTMPGVHYSMPTYWHSNVQAARFYWETKNSTELNWTKVLHPIRRWSFRRRSSQPISWLGTEKN